MTRHPEPAGDWLRRALRDAMERSAGLSVARAASAVGTDPDRLGAYLGGTGDIDSDELAGLIDYLGLMERGAMYGPDQVSAACEVAVAVEIVPVVGLLYRITMSDAGEVEISYHEGLPGAPGEPLHTIGCPTWAVDRLCEALRLVARSPPRRDSA